MNLECRLWFLKYRIKDKILHKNIIAGWWIYYWSKENVWCKDQEAQKKMWLGRLNIIYGILHMPKGI